MPRFAYVNGRFVPHGKAAVHIEDRGYQFADGVYEVIAVMDGKFADDAGHLARLKHSLDALRIPMPMDERALGSVMRTLVRRNGLRDGSIYIQVTRGVAPRDFKFPKNPRPSIVMTTSRSNPAMAQHWEKGVSVVTVKDIRWARREIKTVGLLAQVLAKQAAADAGAFEAWMVDAEGYVTEGGSSNAWIVTKDGVLVTRKPNGSILHGVTGNAIEALAAEFQIPVERRSFTPDEAYRASEAFLTSATTFCVPVVRIDGKKIGTGQPGPVAQKLRAAYFAYARERQSAQIPWAQ